MKKTIFALLAALLAVLPACGNAEGLPGFEAALNAARETQRAQEFIGPMLRTPAPDADAEGLPLVPAKADEDKPEMDATETPAPDGDAQPASEDAAPETDAAETDAPEIDAPETPDADAPEAPDEAAADSAAFADDTPAAEPSPEAVTAARDEDLTLEMTCAAPGVDEGGSVALTLTAANPRAEDTPVTLTLKLPERLVPDGETTWQAVLPAAQDGAPSVTAFTREVTLAPGGEAETAALEAELSMGARFYRANAALELRVPDISVTARAEGTQDGRVQPGDAFRYALDVRNAGTAPHDVAIELDLPDGVTLAGELPEGFAAKGRHVSGVVRAEAARRLLGAKTPSSARVALDVTVDADALEGDDDASRLLSGVLRADGERVSLPRVQACASRVSARLIPERDSLEVGAEMTLQIALVNSGLVPADVRVSCCLPEGLVLAEDEGEATPDEPDAALPPDDGAGPQAAAMLTDEAEQPVLAPTLENGTLVYDVHMDAARETPDGVAASTRVLSVRVRAEREQSALRERLVGASLAYTADGGTKLAEAVAVRVYTPSFLGVSREEWGGIFWAAVLLVVTVACLYAAVRHDDEPEDYVFD